MTDTLELNLDSTLSAVFDAAHETPAPAVEAPMDAPAEPQNTDTGTSATEEIPDQGNETAPDPAIEQPVKAPDRWSAEDKAKFATLTREAQDLVLKRESDVEKHLTQKSQEIADQKRQFEQIEQILAPRRQAFAMDGMNEAQVLNQLFTLSDFANRDPAGFIQYFAQQRGLDLGRFAPQPADDVYVDPALAATQQRINQIENDLRQREAAQEQQRRSVIDAEVAAFKADPKNAYFEDVKNEMASLLKAGLAKDLSDAYEKATYTNSEVRAKLLDQSRKAEEEKRLNEAKAAAAKAKQSSSTNVSSKAATAGKASAASIDETMEAVYERMQGAA